MRTLSTSSSDAAASASTQSNPPSTGAAVSDNDGQPSSSSSSTKADKTIKGKLKTLMKKYGWAAVVVYLLFSALDFGLTFFVINLIGAEHVRRATDYVLDFLVYGRSASNVSNQPGRRGSSSDSDSSSSTGPDPDTSTDTDARGQATGILSFLKDWREKHKKEDAESAAEAGPSGNIWATAVLAYTIHKTLLLPVRLAGTAAATPAIVK